MTVDQFQREFGIIGRSKEIKDLVDIAMQVAKSDISVLIFGESGVGKEIFAGAIHNFSNRKDKALISVNCGAIPEGILESELFGHKKGSFTGAYESRKGYFEIADEGTLFLDEIAEMPLTTPVKLLRVLETKEFLKIGGESYTRVNVRIIAATNKDLQKEVESKRFRDDLYFRLKAVTLTIPPLRKRREDIEPLVRFFIKRYSETNKIDAPLITDETMELLYNYGWPGNIRELKNSIETAIALNREGILHPHTFSSILISKREERDESRNLPIYLRKSSEDLDRELMYRALFEIKRDLIELKEMISRGSEVKSEELVKKEHILPLEEVEKEAVRKAIEYAHGSKKIAARVLQISERTLFRKLKKHGLVDE
jgi:transcriptional regulator with PAS, ATPase and Fis domain